MKTKKTLDSQINFLILTSTLKKVSFFGLIMACALVAIQSIAEVLFNPILLISYL